MMTRLSIISLKCTLFSFILLFSVHSFAQEQDYNLISESEKKLLIEKIKNNSNTTNALQCDFLQEKELTFLTDKDQSKGVMYYKKEQKLRWEYKTPHPFIFILNQSKIYIGNDKGISSHNANSNKMYKAISQLIIGFINGNGLQDNTNFTQEFYSGKNIIFVKLIPRNNDIKKMFTSVVLYLDANSYLAKKIVMNEAGGDITTLTFSNIKRNSTISDDIFNLK